MSITIPPDLSDLLERPLFCSLGTVRLDDTVQVNPMWFEWDGENVRFTHTTKRVKYRNLQRNPAMSMLVMDPDNPMRYLELLRPIGTALRKRRTAASSGQPRPSDPCDGHSYRRAPLEGNAM
jgi:PPOX class probable F420-dependent enzyme